MRTRAVRFLAKAALALAWLPAGAEIQDLEPYMRRYQSIIDRQMFGQPPDGFDPTKSPSEVQKSDRKSAVELTKEQEQLKSAIHFSVVNVAEDGTPMVGFSDNSDAKLPKHYFLRLGEERDGWLVKEADPEMKTMTISKGDIEVELTLGDNSGSGGGKTARAGSGASAKRNAFLFGGGSGGGMSSLRERRMMREQQRQAELQEQEAERQKREEERRQAEESARLDREEREAEREEQRKQLQAIQEELKRAREAREEAEKARETTEKNSGDGDAE